MANFRCSAARSLPINTEKAWDGDAAKSSIFEWAGGEDGKVGSKAKQGFLAYDTEAPDLKGSYKLPFAQVLDGTLTAIASGVRAAASRLPQTDGLSDECKSAARDVIDGYLSKIQDKEGASEDDRTRLLLARMPIDRGDRKPAMLTAGAALPEELLAMVPDPDVITERGVFVFTAVASTNQIDTYGTRMMPSSLRNFSNDAKAGLSLQDSHKTDQAPWGKSYMGRFVGAGGNGMARAEFDIYIIRGLNLTGVNHNDVIDGIRGGSPSDVSVGFYGGRVMCSIDGKEMMTDLFSLLFFGFPDGDEANDPDAPCYHLPGFEYANGKDDSKRVMAVGEIDGAHCAELSLVFDGATPGAHVLSGRSMVPALGEVGGVRCLALAKAERMARAGVLSRRVAASVHTRYRGIRSVALDDLLTRRFPGVSVPSTEFRFGHEPEDIEAAQLAAGRETPPPTLSASEEATAMTGTPVEPPAGGATPAVPPGTTQPNDPAAPPPGGSTVPATPDPASAEAQAAAAGGAVATPGAQPTQPVDPGTVAPPAAAPVVPATPAPPETAAGAATSVVQPPAEQQAGTAAPASPTAPAASAGGPAPDSVAPTSPEQPPAGSPPPNQRDHSVLVRAALVDAQLVPADFVGDPITAIRDLGTTVRNLRGWADIGYRARGELAERVRTEGVRALGAEAFTEQAYGATLRTADWDTLQAMLTSFGSVARARFPGGRASVETPEPGTPAPAQQPPVEVDVPDEAYVARFR